MYVTLKANQGFRTFTLHTSSYSITEAFQGERGSKTGDLINHDEL